MDLKRKKIKFKPEDACASHGELTILGILRIYAETNPGRRLAKYSLYILDPREDLGINVRKLTSEAKKRYNIKRKRRKPLAVT